MRNDVSHCFKGATDAEYEVLQRLLRLEATPEAIREFCRSRSKLRDYAYWFFLGTLWVSYTGHSDLALWKRLLSADRPLKAESLMKPSELLNLNRLPDRIPIYRAHRPKETDWIAYTLDPQIAGRFASERGVNEISMYEVDKADVCALFLRRGEKEVLVLDKSRVRFIRTIPVIYE